MKYNQQLQELMVDIFFYYIGWPEELTAEQQYMMKLNWQNHNPKYFGTIGGQLGALSLTFETLQRLNPSNRENQKEMNDEV